MDIPSFLTTYGGPGGLLVIFIWWTVQSNRFAAERRAELREDIDREQNDNKELRALLSEERAKVAALEAEVRVLQLRLVERGEIADGEEIPHIDPSG